MESYFVTASLQPKEETEQAAGVPSATASLARRGATDVEGRVDERRQRVDLTFRLQGDDLTSARVKLHEMTSELAQAWSIVGLTYYAVAV